MKWDSIKQALTAAVRWVRNVDTNEKLMAAINDTKDSLLTIINDNERSRLRAEIVLYYNRALAGQTISREEYEYLLNEVYTKYKKLNGNGIAAHMMEYLERYITNGGK